MAQLNTGEWKRQRSKALARDGHMCECGEPATEVDHIIPRYLGGTHELENLQSICTPHHKERTRLQSKHRAQSRRRGTATRSRRRPDTGAILSEPTLPPSLLAEQFSPPVGGVQDWFRVDVEVGS